MTKTMREMVIEAEYVVTKIMVVEVPEGCDGMSPADWGDIISETDSDCVLFDVLGSKEND